jgi:hypothetical protein
MIVFPLGFRKRTVSGSAPSGASSITSRNYSGDVATSAATIVCALPVAAWYAADDIMIAHVVTNGDQTSDPFVTPAGWNLIQANYGTRISSALYWHRCTTSPIDTATFGVTTALDGNAMGVVTSAWRGCVTSGNPYSDVAYIDNSQAAVTSHYGADVTPSVDGGLIVYYNGITDNPSITNWPPSGHTAIVDQVNGTGNDLSWVITTYDTQTGNGWAVPGVQLFDFTAADYADSYALVLKPV